MTLAAAALVAMTAAAPQMAGDPFKTLDVWLHAIEQHQIGHDDEAVARMRQLRTWDLEIALPYMIAAISETFSRDDLREGRMMLDETFRKAAATARPSAEQRKLLQALAQRMVMHGGRDAFLKRAAILHADIGIVAPDAHMTLTAGTTTLLHDGLNAGEAGRSWHWMLGRAFLHVVADKSEDAQVRAWYRTVATLLWTRRNFIEAAPLVRQGRDIFPDDAELLFVQGLLHETQAAPHIQLAIDRSSTLRRELVNGRMTLTSNVPSVRPAAIERGIAEEAYRKTLEIDPSHTEARIRYARLLILKKKQGEAAVELRRALGETSDRLLRYWGLLFLGRAEELRDRRDDAIAAFSEAATIFPRAQSPRLALAHLAARAGDRRAAADFVEQVTTAPQDDDDPWWDYYVKRAPDVQTWLDRMWTAFEVKK